MAFDGSEFIGVDDDAFGDGQDDTQPVDTWLQNRLAANAKYLHLGREAVSFNPVNSNVGLTSGTGDRPWTSLDWSSVGLWDVPGWKGLRGVEISIVYAVSAPPSGTQNDVELRAMLGTTQTTQTISNTYSAGVSYEATTIDLELDEDVALDGLSPLPLELWVRGTSSGATGESSTDQQVRGYLLDEPTAGDTLYDGSATGPDDNATETQHATVANGDYEPVPVDLLGASASGEDAIAGGSQPPAYSSGTTVATHYLSYIQIRTISVRPYFRADSVAALPKEMYEPNLSFNSLPSLRQATAVRGIQRRPRVLAYGPEGIIDSTNEEYQGRDYPFRWPYVMGDDGAKALFEHTIWPRTEDPRVVVLLRVTAVHHSQPNSKTGANARGERGACTWTLSADVDQMDSGDTAWASATSLGSASLDVPTTLYPGFLGSNYPLMRQLEHMLQMASASSEIGFGYREGSLFEADLETVQRVAIGVDLSNYDASARTAYPLRLKVSGEIGSSSPDYVTQENASTAYLRLVVLGYTVLEYPQ